MKLIKYFFILTISMSLAFGHRVKIFAYVEGKRIFAECYYSDGSPVKSQKIEVFDKNDNKLLEGKTTNKGTFSFAIPQRTDLKLVLSAGAGHRAEVIVKADDMPDINPAAKVQQKEKKIIKDKSLPQSLKIQKPAEETITIDELTEIFDELLEQKLRPIKKTLIKEQNRISFNEVVAGIGYIFGIMGIILYFKSRKKK